MWCYYHVAILSKLNKTKESKKEEKKKRIFAYEEVMNWLWLLFVQWILTVSEDSLKQNDPLNILLPLVWLYYIIMQMIICR